MEPTAAAPPRSGNRPMPNGYGVIANAALRQRLNLGVISPGYANVDVSVEWAALLDNNIMEVNFGGNSLLLAVLASVVLSTAEAQLVQGQMPNTGVPDMYETYHVPVGINPRRRRGWRGGVGTSLP